MAAYNSSSLQTYVTSRSRTSSGSLLDHDDNSSTSSLSLWPQQVLEYGSSSHSDIDSLSIHSSLSGSSRGSNRSSERYSLQTIRLESDEALRTAIEALKAEFNREMRDLSRSVTQLSTANDELKKENRTMQGKIADMMKESKEIKSQQSKVKEDMNTAMNALRKATTKAVNDIETETASKLGALQTEMNKLKEENNEMHIKQANAIEAARILQTEMFNLREENKGLRSKLSSQHIPQECSLEVKHETSVAHENQCPTPTIPEEPIESSTAQLQEQTKDIGTGPVMKRGSRQREKPTTIKASKRKVLLKEREDVRSLTIQKKKMQQLKCQAANKKEKMRSGARQMQQLCRKKVKHIKHKGRGAIFQPRCAAHRFS